MLTEQLIKFAIEGLLVGGFGTWCGAQPGQPWLIEKFLGGG